MVINYCKALADRIDFDIDFYEQNSAEDSENYIYLLQFCEGLSSYDTSVFELQYLQCLKKKEQAGILKVKANIDSIQETAISSEELINRINSGDISSDYIEKYREVISQRGEALRALCEATSTLARQAVENKI